MTDPYAALGVPRQATEAEIKTAFRRLAKETHPDLNGNNQQTVARFREVAEAYEILSDPDKRREYDAISAQGAYGQNAYGQNASGQGAADWRQAAGARASQKFTADEIERQIHEMYEYVRPYKAQARKSLFVGLAWMIGGILVSLSTVLIAWGAILLGGIQAYRSWRQYTQINRFVANVEEEMWSRLG
jgi:curved DNA-binding protein CbpA